MEKNPQLLIMMIDKRKTGGFFVMAPGLSMEQEWRAVVPRYHSIW
jgi:hypothetical protein